MHCPDKTPPGMRPRTFECQGRRRVLGGWRCWPFVKKNDDRIFWKCKIQFLRNCSRIGMTDGKSEKRPRAIPSLCLGSSRSAIFGRGARLEGERFWNRVFLGGFMVVLWCFGAKVKNGWSRPYLLLEIVFFQRVLGGFQVIFRKVPGECGAGLVAFRCDIDTWGDVSASPPPIAPPR